MLKNLKTRKTIEEIFEYNLLTYKRTHMNLKNYQLHLGQMWKNILY